MLRGIIPAIPTLFTDTGDLNFEAQRSVVRFALMADADGVVFPGVASEYNFLTAAERGELIKLVVEEVDGKVPIVGGASAPTPSEVVSLGNEAIDNGVAYLMIMAPASLGSDLEKHQKFFGEITQELPGCEIILQNAPSPIGAGLTADAIAKIAQVNPAITYVKEETLPSGPRISAILKHSIPNLIGVLGGGGARYLVDELRRGACGAIPAVELTDLHAALYEAYKEGDEEKTRLLYRLSLPLLTAQATYRMRLTKYILQKRGVADATFVRASLPELDSFARKDLDAMFEDLRSTQAFAWTEVSAI